MQLWILTAGVCLWLGIANWAAATNDNASQANGTSGAKTTTVTGSGTVTATSSAAKKTTAFKSVDVSTLATWLKSQGKVHVYDANTIETRQKSGVIPGAFQLASVTQYDVASTLPADKASRLVFYCANTECKASHSAAQRAMEAGYQDVYVMSDGIAGWVKAGKATEKPHHS